jgi:hypothetical protein
MNYNRGDYGREKWLCHCTLVLVQLPFGAMNRREGMPDTGLSSRRERRDLKLLGDVDQLGERSSAELLHHLRAVALEVLPRRAF